MTAVFHHRSLVSVIFTRPPEGWEQLAFRAVEERG